MIHTHYRLFVTLANGSVWVPSLPHFESPNTLAPWLAHLDKLYALTHSDEVHVVAYEEVKCKVNTPFSPCLLWRRNVRAT